MTSRDERTAVVRMALALVVKLLDDEDLIYFSAHLGIEMSQRPEIQPMDIVRAQKVILEEYNARKENKV